tara:strand:+ start:521 stop:817 length:297 start_codon:yes stop_codon:yes gene_type:complete
MTLKPAQLKPTSRTTKTGRRIYKLGNRDVSEISTTLKYKGKWINIPTIHNGKIVRSEKKLKQMLDNNEIKPTSTHKSLALAEAAAAKRSKLLTRGTGF